MVTIDLIKDFFNSYAKHKSVESEEKVNRLAAFVQAYEPALEESRAHIRKCAPDFNIFRVLGVSHYEVTTHSAFIRELLDSSGTHGQGNLFFKLFLEHLSTRGIVDINDIAYYTEEIYDDYTCTAEQTTESGRLDIVIERKRSGRDFCLYIENKIYAIDQEKQLERYHHELHQHKAPAHRKKLIYLTMSGRKPDDCTLDESCYACISYASDIKAWLERCRVLIHSKKIVSIIDQYLLTLANL